MAGRWNARPELSGGGAVMGNASHALDVLGSVLDAPIGRVAATFGPRVVAPEVEDTAELWLDTVAGTLARVALSWSYFTEDLDYLMVQGTEGALRVAWTGGLVRLHGARDWAPFGAFGRQLEAFIAAVQGEGGRPQRASAMQWPRSR